MTRAFLNTTSRNILLAAGLVFGLALAVPAQAADNVQFGFSFGTGNSTFGFSVGNGGYTGRHFTPPARQPVCMSEDQMRAHLRQLGYRWINFGGERRGWVHVNARNYGRDYSLDMHRCTGTIANVVATGGWGSGNPSQGGFNGGWQQNSGFGGNWGGSRPHRW